MYELVYLFLSEIRFVESESGGNRKIFQSEMIILKEITFRNEYLPQTSSSRVISFFWIGDGSSGECESDNIGNRISDNEATTAPITASATQPSEFNTLTKLYLYNNHEITWILKVNRQYNRTVSSVPRQSSVFLSTIESTLNKSITISLISRTFFCKPLSITYQNPFQ